MKSQLGRTLQARLFDVYPAGRNAKSWLDRATGRGTAEPFAGTAHGRCSASSSLSRTRATAAPRISLPRSPTWQQESTYTGSSVSA